MTSRVWAFPSPISLESNGMFVSESLYPWHRPVAAWLKYVRVYEHCPELAIPEANAVLADALGIGNQDSADALIRDTGIVGCWRPSSVIVVRFTNYVAARQLVADPVVAHALWNVDLHEPVDRHTALGIEILNDDAAFFPEIKTERRTRWIRVCFELVEMTDDDLDIEHSVPSLVARVRQLEHAVKILGTFASAVDKPALDAARKKLRGDG